MFVDCFCDQFAHVGRLQPRLGSTSIAVVFHFLFAFTGSHTHLWMSARVTKEKFANESIHNVFQHGCGKESTHVNVSGCAVHVATHRQLFHNAFLHDLHKHLLVHLKFLAEGVQMRQNGDGSAFFRSHRHFKGGNAVAIRRVEEHVLVARQVQFSVVLHFAFVVGLFGLV